MKWRPIAGLSLLAFVLAGAAGAAEKPALADAAQKVSRGLGWIPPLG